MFELLGDSAADAKANARIVMEIETALAKASLTRVDKRDPYKLFHKLNLKQVQALTPVVSLGALLYRAIGLASTPVINVTEPEFFKELQTLLASRVSPIGKPICAGTLRTPKRALSLLALRPRRISISIAIPARRYRAAAALETMRAVCRSRSGRGAGQSLRGEDLRTRCEGARRSP